ncbi:unnamed protein product [Closterium sp. NIES-53]
MLQIVPPSHDVPGAAHLLSEDRWGHSSRSSSSSLSAGSDIGIDCDGSSDSDSDTSNGSGYSSGLAAEVGEEPGKEQDAREPLPDEAPPARPAHPAALHALYLTFVFNCFGEQSWRFAGTASLALLHHLILPVAVAKFVSQLMACVAAPLMGDLLDSAPRLPALTTILVAQSTAIMVGAAATMHALHLAFPDTAAAAAAGTAGTSALCVLPAAAVLQQGWFAVVVVAGAVERCMGLATGVAVEIDWVLVVPGTSALCVLPAAAVLQQGWFAVVVVAGAVERCMGLATGVAVEIDWVLVVAGKFIFGALIATCGPLVCVRACLALAALSIPALLALTALTNHLSHEALSQTCPLEATPSTQRLVPAASAASHDEATDTAAVQPASATSAAAAFDTMGGATGVSSSLAALDDGALVSAESMQGGALVSVPMSTASHMVDAAAVPSKEAAGLDCSLTIMQEAASACDIIPVPPTSPARVTATAALSPSVSAAEVILWRCVNAVVAAAGAAVSAVGRAAGKGWRSFVQEEVMPASMAYVPLCFNAVLAPGVLMTSFLFHHGPFLCPSHHAHCSFPSSLYQLQVSIRAVVPNLLLLPTSACDLPEPPRVSVHAGVGMGVIGAFSSAGAAMGFAASFVSPALVAHLGILQHRPCLLGRLARPHRARVLLSPSLPSLSVPMPAHALPLASGAFPHGQGVYQIVEGQIIQAVPAASANLFGTTEMALGCLAELSMLSLAIVFHDPKYFGALVLMSLAGGVAAAVLYCSWLAFPDPRLQILFPNQPKVQWGNVIWWGMGQGEKPGGKAEGKGFCWVSTV